LWKYLNKHWHPIYLNKWLWKIYNIQRKIFAGSSLTRFCDAIYVWCNKSSWCCCYKKSQRETFVSTLMHLYSKSKQFQSNRCENLHIGIYQGHNYFWFELKHKCHLTSATKLVLDSKKTFKSKKNIFWTNQLKILYFMYWKLFFSSWNLIKKSSILFDSLRLKCQFFRKTKLILLKVIFILSLNMLNLIYCFIGLNKQ